MSSRTPISNTKARLKRMPRHRAATPWNNGAIPVIGCVGGMRAGKSTVARFLVEGGAHPLDADLVGHALIDQKPTRERVVARFGTGVLSRDVPTHIDRGILGSIVFNDA